MTWKRSLGVAEGAQATGALPSSDSRKGEARRAGARILTGSRVDGPALAASAPDAVVLATGARPRRPRLELMDDPVVLDAWSVIRGGDVPRGRIVVADWRGGWIGLGVALQLAAMRRKVTLCVTGFAAGEHLQQYVRAAMPAQAVRARIEIVPNVGLYGADSDTVYLQHTPTEEPVLIEGTAGAVLAQGHIPVDELDPVVLGVRPTASSQSAIVSPRHPARRGHPRCLWRASGRAGRRQARWFGSFLVGHTILANGRRPVRRRWCTTSRCRSNSRPRDLTAAG
ncbi:hypothetical protein QFZ82_000646 [Streptomyces sp. V4I23]|uniref:NAD(P)/FAD-dependent oxidoreductase n=1 Tax=Streptomyces sp. V4I23 TaxID=3042282 RepID=UPI0027844C93|nr:FAD/NAD(P)-binding oxidoreductase [Streptomyces sp. V4I23]MDQ1006161.1 hypothetical protein [Streptomyces sp. V4I23]